MCKKVPGCHRSWAGRVPPKTDQGSFSSIKVNAEAMGSKQQKAMTEVGSDRPARTASESWAMPTAPPPPGLETGSLQ